MSETRLILHVKGTHSETTELPKDAVRAGISQGQITQSQLIWSTADNAWKQVKDLPDLLPGERLILHVKGTESETRELPKQVVQEGISQGKITQSQLIWSVPDSTWKQVKDLPDLLPGERLILHVKGTEAETKELPKQAIRTAISQGHISHSQLIWSSSDNAWKQVREMPELLPSQKLAPAPPREPVSHAPKAVEGPTPVPIGRPVARVAAATPHVRVAHAAAVVPHVHVDAVPTVTARAQVAAPPSVTPQVRVAVAAATASQASMVAVPVAVPQVGVADATAETPQASEVAAPMAAAQVRVAEATTETPRVSAVAAPVAAPQVRVAAASTQTPAVHSRVPEVASSTRSHVVKENDEYHPMKWVCIALGVIIVLVLGGNFLLVDQPLSSNLKQTTYSNMAVYAHLGAFMQPGVMVIHIPSSSNVTPDNLVDFLVALAHSTPQSPITSDLYDRVALTSGWTAQYSFSGGDWKQFGDMNHESADVRKDFLMSHMGDASGHSIMPASTLSESAQDEQREKVWNAFVAHFTTQH